MSPRQGLNLPIILKMAAEIADTNGVEAVTLATLAKKLNIRPPSLYNHIDGLQGLRKQLTLYGIKQLYNHLIRAAVERSGDETIHAFGDAYVNFARTHPGLYEATFLDLDHEDFDIQAASKDIVDLSLRILAYYDLEDESALHATRGLRSIFHGFSSIEQRGGFGMDLDLDVSFHLIIDAYLAGIGKIKENGIKMRPSVEK